MFSYHSLPRRFWKKKPSMKLDKGVVHLKMLFQWIVNLCKWILMTNMVFIQISAPLDKGGAVEWDYWPGRIEQNTRVGACPSDQNYTRFQGPSQSQIMRIRLVLKCTLTLSSDQLHKIDIDKKAPRLTVICHLLQNLKCGSLGAPQASLLQS